MEVDVNDAGDRKHPAKVEVEELDPVEELLVHVWVLDVRHGYKLARHQGIKQMWGKSQFVCVENISEKKMMKQDVVVRALQVFYMLVIRSI